MVCAASGPSLCREDVDYCRERGWPVWATNSSYKLGCDGLYACDYLWWRANPEAARTAPECWTQDKDASEAFGLNWIESLPRDGFSEDPRWIHQGKNSGFQLVNLVYLWGAARIVLLGYDMRLTDKSHWHGDHKGTLKNPTASMLADCVKAFDKVQPLACEVVNCTPGSAIKRFPFADLRSL